MELYIPLRNGFWNFETSFLHGCLRYKRNTRVGIFKFLALRIWPVCLFKTLVPYFNILRGEFWKTNYFCRTQSMRNYTQIYVKNEKFPVKFYTLLYYILYYIIYTYLYYVTHLVCHTRFIQTFITYFSPLGV